MEGDSRSGSQRLLVLGAGPAQLGLLEAARARGPGWRWSTATRVRPVSRSQTGGDRLGRGRAGDRASRRRARHRRHHRAGDRLAGRVAARIAEHAGLPHPISPTDRRARDEQAAPARAPRGRRRASAEIAGSSAATTPCRRSRPGRRQGARPAGPEGPLARRVARVPRRGDRARAQYRPHGLALVEELVDGPEVTVNAFSVNGALHGADRHRPDHRAAARLRRRSRTRLAEPRPGSDARRG